MSHNEKKKSERRQSQRTVEKTAETEMMRGCIWFMTSPQFLLFFFFMTRRNKEKSHMLQHKLPWIHCFIMRTIQARAKKSIKFSCNREESKRELRMNTRSTSQVWSINHIMPRTTPWDLHPSCLMSVSHFSFHSDLPSAFVSIFVCDCLMFGPLWSVAAHARHQIHFSNALQEWKVVQRSMDEEPRGLGLNGAEHLLSSPTDHHTTTTNTVSPASPGQRPGDIHGSMVRLWSERQEVDEIPVQEVKKKNNISDRLKLN